MDNFKTVKDYNNYIGIETLHPLVSVINFDDIPSITHSKYFFDVYAVFLKDINCGNIIYGCQSYDYDEGTLVFVSPGQIYGIDGGGIPMKPSGYGLIFHPDLFLGTTLAKKIGDYNFFSYEVNEALHLSKKERITIIAVLEKITEEINSNIDQHSKTLIVSNIELFLNYCKRFYDRQFITRSHANKDILVRFENLLTNYFNTDKGEKLGIPNVSYCAKELFLSPNYFGDLIKKETGRTALDHIHASLINKAKEIIFDQSKSISQISFELGFKYQQHFTRLFKKEVGVTPNEYRNLN